MTRIREDLTGVVHTDRGVLHAGDEIPEGVSIGGHLTETGQPVGLFKTVAREHADGVEVVDSDVLREVAVEPLTEDELVEAERIGVPRDVHPERVRGAIVGYAQGWDDAHAAFTVPPTPDEDALDLSSTPPGQDDVLDLDAPLFDPSEHNALAVHEYLKGHPEAAERVIAAERLGKQRSGILERYAA